MVDGPRLLREHLTASNLSLRSFGESVGTSGSLVWMWCQDERTPGVEFALRIEAATQGRIRPIHWVEQAPGGRARPKRRRSRKQSGKRVVREAARPRSVKRSAQH